MFEIEINEPLKIKLQELNETTKRDEFNTEINSYLQKKSIPISALLDFYETYWKDAIRLKDLLTPFDFKFKEKYVPGSGYSTEFKKQLELLSLKEQELEYQTMIRNDKSITLQTMNMDNDNLTMSKINKQIKEQITTIFNILISVLSVIWAIWYWSKSSAGLAIHYRILLCLFFGLLVLIAEVVLYKSYLNKIHDAKVREKNKKERKKIVKTL
ncbi:hypothetical protein KAFR_0D03080 [Kazachstania africana CBS 2517]|uniref:Vacuolar ATPase assembly integral membrane protein VPH2 n=1 Tax=Kazachstania africana (strain ATCC 22294 / BCRC 22015 / CBS 2517 / CECT 1963 / NBRC 1671 / NRRL Y-8276) TaxID=1071382 RepID=H2AUA6_KAZAF|nr:hypothetical protein KAFR_0D03080 [Kazachstania africana CBS 2517]CCF57956.1 hypothetical protein KAFR_0D03080 [Kazachstania africana CBS 2517]